MGRHSPVSEIAPLTMEWFFNWPVWIAWWCGIVWLTRVILAFVLRQFLDRRTSYVLAYTFLVFFPLIGLLVIGASGMQMYGFDRTDGGHRLGYFMLVFSPFGIPLALGLPVVFLADLSRRPWRVEEQNSE